MKKIVERKVLLYIFTTVILVLLPVLKQTSFYLAVYRVINYYDSINPSYIFYFCIPFFIYVYIKNLIDTKRKLDIYDYLFYTLVAVGIIVTLFSIDKKISLFGKDYRHEGFFSILSYYLLFITWKVEGNKKDIKNVANIILFMAIINSIYAIGQLYTPFRFILRFGTRPDMASGLCGNPNFFGSLIVTALSIVTSKFLIDKISFKRIILLILLFISLINSQSMGPYLTYALTLIFLIVFLAIKKKLIVKNTILIILILVTTYFSLYYMNKIFLNINDTEFGRVVNTLNNDKLNKKEKTNQLSSGRIEIWEKSLDIALKNPILGVGYDNLHLAYYEGINLTEVTFVSSGGKIQAVKKYQAIVDNAHNVYLHIWASSGLIGLIPYLILCLYTFIRGLKSKENLVLIILGGFVAYSIQAFVNINVIQVTPIYYVLIGLILSIKQ